MNWLLKLVRKDPERLVHTMKLPIVQSKTKEKGFLVIHFYESQFGRKRFTLSAISFTIPDEYARELLESFSEFHDVIVPWLAGRFVPDVPKYDDIDNLDLMERLKQ